MPKVRRVHSLSFDGSRAPYPCTSKDGDSCKPTKPDSLKDVKEWDEARCPICMEHPHNAILLICSSYENGCRPYMCNTSYRHSNCFDQFSKSSVPYPSTAILQQIPLTSTASRRTSEEQSLPGETRPCASQLQSQLVCPLCRGEIFGYNVVEPARQYMNIKVRSCSSESCNLSGTYSELRKHARSEHPSVRPSEVDPTRQRDWVRLECERDLEDVLSLVQPGLEEESESNPSENFDSLISSFLSVMLRSLEFVVVTRLLDASRDREHSHNRRSTRMPRVNYDADSSYPATRRSHSFYESNPHTRRLRWRANHDTATIPVTRRGNGWPSDSIPRARRLRWRNQRWWSTSNNQHHRWLQLHFLWDQYVSKSSFLIVSYSYIMSLVISTFSFRFSKEMWGCAAWIGRVDDSSVVYFLFCFSRWNNCCTDVSNFICWDCSIVQIGRTTKKSGISFVLQHTKKLPVSIFWTFCQF